MSVMLFLTRKMSDRSDVGFIKGISECLLENGKAYSETFSVEKKNLVTELEEKLKIILLFTNNECLFYYR